MKRSARLPSRRAHAVESFKTAAECIGDIDHGMHLFAITRGQFSMIDAVLHVLDEVQARALDALVGYGASPFIETFYKHMGRHYLQPYEGGLRRLFRAVEEQVRPQLARVDRAREAVENELRPAQQESLADG